MTAGSLITGKWQAEWRNTLLGWPATNLVIRNVTGWDDMPPGRSNPVDIPGQHGQIPSDFLLSSRTIEIEFWDNDDDPAAFRNLRDIVAPGLDDGEETLAIYLDETAYRVQARCEGRAIPNDLDWSNGYRRATLRFRATDPRKYLLPVRSASIGLPLAIGGGLQFPLVAPFDFGAGPGISVLNVFNAGAVPAWPKFVITGPVPGPIIGCGGNQLLFDPTYLIGAGEQLVIDTAPGGRSVILASGQGRRGRLFTDDWFPLYPGNNQLTFTGVGSYDPAAQLAVTWGDPSI